MGLLRNFHTSRKIKVNQSLLRHNQSLNHRGLPTRLLPGATRIPIAMPVPVTNQVTVKFQGRLGNQMFQYAVLYSLLRRRPDLRGVVPRWSGQPYFKLDPKITVGDIRSRQFNEPPGQRYTDAVYKVAPGTKLHGYFQTERYFVDLRDEILNIYSLRPELQRRLDALVSRFQKPIIAVHSRETDYLDNKLYIGPAYFRAALDCLCNLTGAKISDYEVVLLSDNPASKILDFLGTGFTRVRESEILDMMLMSRARHCVISASSFSWWGAWLNRGEPVVVAPDGWFSHNRPHAIGFAPVDIKVPRWQYIKSPR